MNFIGINNEAGTLITANRPLHYERKSLAHRVPNHCFRNLAGQEAKKTTKQICSISRTDKTASALANGDTSEWMLDLERFRGHKNIKVWKPWNYFRWCASDAFNASAILRDFHRTNSRRSFNLSQMRRDPMLESGSSICRNPGGKHYGRCIQGKNGEWRQKRIETTSGDVEPAARIRSRNGKTRRKEGGGNTKSDQTRGTQPTGNSSLVLDYSTTSEHGFNESNLETRPLKT